MPISTPEKRLLLFGASRGLGLAIAEEHLKLGWRVVATARQETGTALHGLVDEANGRLDIEIVDITDPNQVAALHGRLESKRFDLLFVNAGVTNDDRETIADVSTEEFVRVMVTNALSPMRIVEAMARQFGWELRVNLDEKQQLGGMMIDACGAFGKG